MSCAEPRLASKRLPPPLLFLVSYVAGEGLHHVIPLFVESLMAAHASRIAGALVALSGITLVLTCVAIFRSKNTTVIPHHRSTELVIRGPYRVTRNPMYLGVAVVYVGVSLLRGIIWPVLLLPVPLVILDKVVIPQEESQLAATFGGRYSEYCARVPRWL